MAKVNRFYAIMLTFLSFAMHNALFQKISTLTGGKGKVQWQPAYPVELVVAVLGLREKYPRWGKYKPMVLVCEHGFSVSTSIWEGYYASLRSTRLSENQ